MFEHTPNTQKLETALRANLDNKQLEELRETIMLSEQECYAGYLLELIISQILKGNDDDS